MRISRSCSAVVLVVVVSGCASGGGSAKSESSPPEPASSTSGSASSTQDALSSVALRTEDLPAGVTLTLVPGGDQVANQVTLDMCGAQFPSEKLRTNRLQRIAKDSSNVTVVDDENVRYGSAQGAEQALTELRQAISGCDPSKFVVSHVSGVPPLRYEIVAVPEPQLTGLAQDHVGVSATLTAQSGKTMNSVLLYQRRGAVLVGIYGHTVEQLLPFAHLVATRLAALTPDEAGD